jgi:hypothetical protein
MGIVFASLAILSKRRIVWIASMASAMVGLTLAASSALLV